MAGIILETQECAKALNELARHQAICKIQSDILIDMQICELEGWDRMEYIRQLQILLNSFTKENKDDNHQ